MLKATILLAEPSKIQQLTSGRILRKAGCKVLIAEDGEEVLRMARKNIPDVILLELLLPRLRGREALRTLKNDPAMAQIPIVVLSSLPQSNEERLKKEGAAGYFAKSRLTGSTAIAGEKALLQLIEAIVQKPKATAGKPRPQAPARA